MFLDSSESYKLYLSGLAFVLLIRSVLGRQFNFEDLIHGTRTLPSPPCSYRSPLESGGLHWTPLEFYRTFFWHRGRPRFTVLQDFFLTVLTKLWWTHGGIHWTQALDSSGVQ